MRQVFFILPFLFILSCSDNNKIRISGEIDNGKDKTVYLDKIELAGPAAADSSKISSRNRFSFSQKISRPAFYRLRLDSNNYITLLAEPGERITIEADAANLPGTYKVSGSEGSEQVKQLNDRLLITQKQIQPLIKEITSLDDAEGFEEEEMRINQELADILKAQRDFSVKFIMENMESMAAITALYQQIDEIGYVLNQTRDIQYLKIVSQSLMKKYPDSPHVKALAADAENQERQYELYKLLNMAEEQEEMHSLYPDVAMPGTDGDTVRLYSLSEKYILLFFGSSLNQESVQLSHDLLPVYEAYHNKGFQIYQVSVERDRQEWLRRIEFSELPWVHVAEFGDEDFTAAQLYNVQQIPSNYLINRDAGVVAKNISAAELRRRLARVLE